MDWKQRLSNLTSRKFLTAVGVEVGLLLGMLNVPQANTIADVIVKVGLIVGMVGVALGYIVAEAATDKAAKKNGKVPLGFKAKS